MTRSFLSAPLLALAVLVVAGCGSDDTTGPDAGNGPLSLKVSGSSWAPTTLNTQWKNDILAIGGSEFGAGTTKQLNITGPVSEPGTYPLTLTSSVRAIWSETAMTSSGVNSKIFTARSGTLVVQELTATGAKGTFSFEGNTDISNGAGEGRSITEGTFNLTF